MIKMGGFKYIRKEQRPTYTRYIYSETDNGSRKTTTIANDGSSYGPPTRKTATINNLKKQSLSELKKFSSNPTKYINKIKNDPVGSILNFVKKALS
jgi:hypothetical protein